MSGVKDRVDVAYVYASIEAIKTHARRPHGGWDHEAAHDMEDGLYRAVLEAIAEGRCEDPQACAELVVTTQQLDFARWTA